MKFEKCKARHLEQKIHQASFEVNPSFMYGKIWQRSSQSAAAGVYDKLHFGDNL